jgi:glycosyltransferase involved in cell wall biosynthesis
VINHGLNELFLEKTDVKPQNMLGEYYLYVSTVDVYKSHMELIDSWCKLYNSDFNKKLVFIGPKDTYYGKLVEEKINSTGMNDNIIYLGKVPYQELPAYYQSAKALVYASVCENCPNILLESMASGKMIFSSSVAPMPEFGADSVIYFNPLNSDELVDLVLKYDADVESQEYFSNKAYMQAQKFDWKKTSLQTFEYLVSGKGNV